MHAKDGSRAGIEEGAPASAASEEDGDAVSKDGASVSFSPLSLRREEKSCQECKKHPLIKKEGFLEAKQDSELPHFFPKCKVFLLELVKKKEDDLAIVLLSSPYCFLSSLPSDPILRLLLLLFRRCLAGGAPPRSSPVYR